MNKIYTALALASLSLGSMSAETLNPVSIDS